MSTVAVLLLVLCGVFAYADERVKNATAGGGYGYNQGYYDPNSYGSFLFPGLGYGAPPPLPPPPPFSNVLLNSHACSVHASYPVYAFDHHRRNFKRPHIRDCSDAFYGGFDTSQRNRGLTDNNCDKCCKIAARLDGFSEVEIFGMMIILDKKAKCACCAPNRPFERILAVPVQIPGYQPPPYQVPPYQQNAPPTSYQPPVYSMNNDQPTGY